MNNLSSLPESSSGPLNSAAVGSTDSRAAVTAQFERITQSDYRWFFGFALRIAKNHHDAEDAVQDAFLAAYQHLDELKSDRKMSPWIASIVLNCARMQYRVKNRFAFSLDEELNSENETRFLDTLQDSSVCAEDRYAALEIAAKLNKLIDLLPAKQRQTFLLRRVEGLNTAETAATLGITDRLVRVRLSRASARMKELITRHIAGIAHRAPRATKSDDSRNRRVVLSRRPEFVCHQINETANFSPFVACASTRFVECQ